MTPKEKHVKQDQEFIDTCKRLTDALFDYLTISTKQCMASHTDPEELIKGKAYLDHLEEQRTGLISMIENSPDETTKGVLRLQLGQLDKAIEQCEKDLATVQADLEKGI